MSHADLAAQIAAAWERRDQLSPQSKGADVEAIEAALDLLDSGQARVAERGDDGAWVTQQWLKQAVLLSFRTSANAAISGAPGGASWWDKVPSKFAGWSERKGTAAVQELLADYKIVPEFTKDPMAFVDWGQSKFFTLDDMGEGECAV